VGTGAGWMDQSGEGTGPLPTSAAHVAAAYTASAPNVRDRTWCQRQAGDGVLAGLERGLGGPRVYIQGHDVAVGAGGVHQAVLAREGQRRDAPASIDRRDRACCRRHGSWGKGGG